jgi:tetratricopeptide (TPR) repeat protein
MADPITVPKAELDRAAYVAVAGARVDAETDILAGIAQQIVVQRPRVTTAHLRDAIVELRDTIVANRPARQAELSSDSALLMSRLLTRVVPKLTNPVLKAAARAYTRAFLNSYRRGTSSLRQVAPIDLQFDRFGEVERFRRETWQRLHSQARAKKAVAQGIDGSPIAAALGVRTTQNATTVLGLAELEPLRTFVAARTQPGGTIAVTRADVDATLASAGSAMTGLSASYAANLVTLNEAQQRATGKVPGGSAAAPPSEFEKAIKEAEKKQKELDDILKGATKGVKGTFGVLSFAAGQLGDSDLATSIDEYGTILVKMLGATQDFAEAAIAIAKAIEGLDDVTPDQILLGAGLGFNFAMIAVAIQISGLLGKPKPPTQIILEQLKEIRKQIVDLRDEMRVRFDRIEKRLNTLYVGILNRLAEMDFDLGQIEGNVDELQVALYDLHSAVQRLTRDVHGFLEAAHRRELVEAINGFLRFRERNGEDLSTAEFRTAENEFFSWGNDHSKDILQAGPDDRSFADEDVLSEITSLPLATNVNYLRRFPAERLNLAPLAAVRLANPFDWIVAGEAYAQLREESPARTVSSSRVQALIAVGEALGTALSRIADDALFGALSEHYRASFGALKEAIADFEQEFRKDPDTQLQEIDLWGGVNQVPKTHPLDASFTDLRRCDGRNFDASHDTVPVLPSIGSGFDYSILRPYMIASNLSRSVIPGVADGLAALSACVSARWDVQDFSPAFGGKVRVTYQLAFGMDIRYGSTVVFSHSYRTTETMQLLVPKTQFENGTFNPATDPLGKDPHTLLVGTKNLWAKLDTFPASHGLVNAPLRDATIALLGRKLILLQRAFYAEVARRFTQAGDAIQRAGQVLNGSKLLWQAFVTAGLPLRTESNEILRSLLFGGDAILGGSDADGQDSLLDDVQDLYAFFSGRPEDPPPANIAGDIEALATARAGQLSALLTEIVAAIKETGEPEPPELFAPTLLRLRLI